MVITLLLLNFQLILRYTSKPDKIFLHVLFVIQFASPAMVLPKINVLNVLKDIILLESVLKQYYAHYVMLIAYNALIQQTVVLAAMIPITFSIQLAFLVILGANSVQDLEIVLDASNNISFKMVVVSFWNVEIESLIILKNAI